MDIQLRPLYFDSVLGSQYVRAKGETLRIFGISRYSSWETRMRTQNWEMINGDVFMFSTAEIPPKRFGACLADECTRS